MRAIVITLAFAALAYAGFRAFGRRTSAAAPIDAVRQAGLDAKNVHEGESRKSGFHDAQHYIAHRGVALSEGEVAELQAIIDDLNVGWNAVADRRQAAIDELAQQKIERGEFRPLAASEPLIADPQVPHTKFLLSQEGLRSVAIHAGESRAVDQCDAELASLEREGLRTITSFLEERD